MLGSLSVWRTADETSEAKLRRLYEFFFFPPICLLAMYLYKETMQNIPWS